MQPQCIVVAIAMNATRQMPPVQSEHNFLANRVGILEREYRM